VAVWAQLASVMELVTGVASAGVATGLAVYVARGARPSRQQDLLREALRLGLGAALPVALAVALAGYFLADELSGGRLTFRLMVIGALAGWIGVIPGLVNGFWLGQQQRGRMFFLALLSAALALAASALAPAGGVLEWLALSQVLPACVLLGVLVRGPARRASPRFRARSHPLRRYVLPGLAIGLLSPASLLAARALVGEALSWHEAGVLQALWRLSDWVCAFAAGVLSVHFLPRFAAMRANGALLGAEVRRAAALTLIPAAAAFFLLFLLHRPLLAVLYGPGFAVSNVTAALLFAGSLVRISSWIPLFALYAMRRTRSIAFGELLSLPLFAVLLAFAGERLTLESAAGLWLASYAAYGLFNFRALARAR
jgi:PST family polysaccharide transporter